MASNESTVDNLFNNVMAIAREYDAAIIQQDDDLCLCCLQQMQNWHPVIIPNYRIRYRNSTYSSALVFTCDSCRKVMKSGNNKAALQLEAQIVTHLDADLGLKFGGA